MENHHLSFRFASLVVLGLVQLLTTPSTSLGQGTPTPVRGSLSIDLPGGTKTWTSVPFTRPAEFVGRVSAVSAGRIEVAPAPNWRPGRFVYAAAVQQNHYFALIGPKPEPMTGTVAFTKGQKKLTGVSTAFGTEVEAGDGLILGGQTYVVAKTLSPNSLMLDRPITAASANAVKATYSHSPREGRAYEVTNNDTGSISVEAAEDDLGAVTAGTMISLVPYWTLGTVFPAVDAGRSFIESDNSSKGTIVVIGAVTGNGGAATAAAIYHFTRGAWREVGHDARELHDDDILPPAACFTVENPAGKPTVLRASGMVQMHRLCVPLATSADAVVDNAVGLMRPVPVTLDALGLLANHAFVQSDASGHGDRLLLQASAHDGKPVIQSFYHDRKGWHEEDGDPAADLGAMTAIRPGAGLIISKDPQPAGIDLWSNPPGYAVSKSE